MIKCDRGDVEVRGSGSQLRSEFATLVNAMKFDIIPKMELNEDPEKVILDIVKSAFKSEEELVKEVRRKGGEVLKGLLRSLLEELEEDDD